MPFKSGAQRRFMWLAHPEIARRWAHEYGSGVGLPDHVADNPARKVAKKMQRKRG